MTETKFAPTKANLMKAKSQLDLINEGYDILDKKRKALIGQYNAKINQRNELNKIVNSYIKDVKKNIKKAIVTTGEDRLKSIALSVPIDNSISLKEKKFMQTKIFEISFDEKKLDLSYSLNLTNSLFDEALISLNDLKEKVYKLAELDTTIKNLDTEIKKTSKKVNSLEKVQIPNYKSIIKSISGQIEEREREEFSKTKMVKDKKIQKGK
ncbi:V-type ATP synthase subunit D [Anaerococcus hydrogenalis]|uniref:V-type ATP synthase subunit D n=2 Tax=Anaerococcus hydrogenalis TaxID=33029 RepID=F0GZP5_9FIRM|nr:V-type ATP synthase subunit D [Anaerococcus hydrogenalis]EGC84329.1 V-type ATPase, D subunit [Anaerococcus hydrogenalis ACS-025-V-Sch4]MBS5988322.1 V-type ATP synthase subunit D [Anaerococcus hydrogenalis]MDK7694619.1 V-type ATP synthase subunit D [Anaerococcus hydrogenalis]MDK7696397.1 V-type ATP synthase subunit D [Anaerococcus hydrogenalis]MDK7707646.1 V-type ATP synthase subunit D [Anaerococcus hydrogenalis]